MGGGEVGGGRFYELLLNISSKINSLSCDLVFEKQSEEIMSSVLLHLMKEARKAKSDSKQITCLFVFGVCLVVSLEMMSYASIQPIPTEGVHLFFIFLLILPLLSLSFHFSSISSSILKRIPSKDVPFSGEEEYFQIHQNFSSKLNTITSQNLENSSARLKKYVLDYWWVVVLLALGELALFVWINSSSFSFDFVRTFGGISSYTINNNSKSPNNQSLLPHLRETVRFSQNMEMVSLVLCLLFASSTFVFPENSLFNLPPFKNLCWVLICIICILSSLSFWIFSSLIKDSLSFSSLFKLPSYGTFILMSLFPLSAFIFMEINKRKSSKQTKIEDNFRKFEFDIRLGRDSPGKIQETPLC